MRQTFIFNIALLLIVNLLIKPVYIFGIEIPVQNTVGNASYGFYFALLNFTYLFQIINDPGLQNYSSREVSGHPAILKRLMPQVILLKSGLSLLFLLAAGIAAGLMGYWQTDPVLLAIVMLNQVLVGYALYLRTNVAAVGRYSLDGLLSVSDKFFMILAVGMLLYLMPDASFNIRIFALLQGASYLFTIFLSLAALRKWLSGLRFKLKKAEAVALLRATMPYAAVIFLMFVYSRTDGVMIEALLDDGDYQAGIYAAAFRLTDAFTMFAFLFAGLLLPMFSKILASGDPVSSLFRQGMEWISSLALLIALPVYVYREQIMDWLYTDTSLLSGYVLGLLVLAFAFKATNFVSGTLMVASGMLARMNRLLAFTVLVNIVLNFLLIPAQGPAGAATATLITQVMVAVGMYVLCTPMISRESNRRYFIRLTTAIIPFTLAGIFWPDDLLGLDWKIEFLILTLAGMLLLLASGLVRLRDLAYFTRKLGRSN